MIKKIEKTLDKIKEEDFGYCESCGVEIGIRRLEAPPTAISVSIAKHWLKSKEKANAWLRWNSKEKGAQAPFSCFFAFER
ncbi:DnaK suppressor protein [Vibrio cholerae CT 5369-93]|nr:DnaK suppressor protein [Vibrio cholerae CT 5369-93]